MNYWLAAKNVDTTLTIEFPRTMTITRIRVRPGTRSDAPAPDFQIFDTQVTKAFCDASPKGGCQSYCQPGAFPQGYKGMCKDKKTAKSTVGGCNQCACNARHTMCPSGHPVESALTPRVPGGKLSPNKEFEFVVNRQITMLTFKLYTRARNYLGFSEIELFTPAPKSHQQAADEKTDLHWSDATPMEGMCSTSGGTAKKGTPCVFPFVFKGKSYNKCTTVNNGQTPWCSTEKTYKKQWGNCVCGAFDRKTLVRDETLAPFICETRVP